MTEFMDGFTAVFNTINVGYMIGQTVGAVVLASLLVAGGVSIFYAVYYMYNLIKKPR